MGVVVGTEVAKTDTRAASSPRRTRDGASMRLDARSLSVLAALVILGFAVRGAPADATEVRPEATAAPLGCR